MTSHPFSTSTSTQISSPTIQSHLDSDILPVTTTHAASALHHSRFRSILSVLRDFNKRWPGAKPLPFLISILVFFIVRYAIPRPRKVTPQGWQLLAIFLTTIAGLILGPLPVGAWAFVCLTATVLTKTLTFAAAFSAFTNDVIWLIVASFFFSRGFVKTGLGDRIAMYFVRMLGKRTLGLAYGLAICEAVICPAVPSSTARAGGIFLPIIKSLASSVDSRPNDKSARRLGAFLVQSQLQVQMQWRGFHEGDAMLYILLISL